MEEVVSSNLTRSTKFLNEPTIYASTLAGVSRPLVVVCGKQNNDYALGCGAANPGCSRLSAGA
jgi:hypothetical protein